MKKEDQVVEFCDDRALCLYAHDKGESKDRVKSKDLKENRLGGKKISSAIEKATGVNKLKTSPLEQPDR